LPVRLLQNRAVSTIARSLVAMFGPFGELNRHANRSIPFAARFVNGAEALEQGTIGGVKEQRAADRVGGRSERHEAISSSVGAFGVRFETCDQAVEGRCRNCLSPSCANADRALSAPMCRSNREALEPRDGPIEMPLRARDVAERNQHERSPRARFVPELAVGGEVACSRRREIARARRRIAFRHPPFEPSSAARVASASSLEAERLGVGRIEQSMQPDATSKSALASKGPDPKGLCDELPRRAPGMTRCCPLTALASSSRAEWPTEGRLGAKIRRWRLA
jgi:hypothetical protein